MIRSSWMLKTAQQHHTVSLFVCVGLLLLQLQRSSPQAGPGQRRPTGRRDQCYVQGTVPTRSTTNCVCWQWTHNEKCWKWILWRGISISNNTWFLCIFHRCSISLNWGVVIRYIKTVTICCLHASHLKHCAPWWMKWNPTSDNKSAVCLVFLV